MDFYISRAMQIAGMGLQQINALHDIELTRGYCLANFNIQQLFGLPTIKERWLIPDDGAAQEAHANRLRTDLLAQKIAADECVEMVDKEGNKTTVVLRPWQWISTGNVKATHQFDARVYDALQEEGISFVYEGGGASSGARLRDRVKPHKHTPMELV